MSSGTTEQPELQPKTVLDKIRHVPHGWDAWLDCGHVVYFAVEPGEKSFCGVCVDAFVQRARRAGQVGD